MSKFLTFDGLQKIKSQLEELKKKRIDIARRIEESKALGDLSENADYIKTKEEQAFNEGRIKEFEHILAHAEIIDTKLNNKDEVGVGSKIIVKSNGHSYEYTIVGVGESDPEKGLISNESPLGLKFMGKKIGDQVEVNTPSGRKIYKITAIK